MKANSSYLEVGCSTCVANDVRGIYQGKLSLDKLPEDERCIYHCEKF